MFEIKQKQVGTWWDKLLSLQISDLKMFGNSIIKFYMDIPINISNIFGVLPVRHLWIVLWLKLNSIKIWMVLSRTLLALLCWFSSFGGILCLVLLKLKFRETAMLILFLNEPDLSFFTRFRTASLLNLYFNDY